MISRQDRLDYDDAPYAGPFDYEDAMPDDVIPWWRDGAQVRGILSDIGKWLLIAAAAYWAHTAQMDAAEAKRQTGANAARLSTLEKGRPLVYGGKE